MLRIERGLEPAPYEKLRAVASSGGRGLIGAAFELKHRTMSSFRLLTVSQPRINERWRLTVALFDGVPTLLACVVTGWAGASLLISMRFTDPLVRKLACWMRYLKDVATRCALKGVGYFSSSSI